MAIALTSLGVRAYYIKATDSAVPAGQALSGFTEIPEVKNIPNLSPAPDTIETTPLSNTEYKTYAKGLKDLGGAIDFTANLTQELLNMWNGTSDTNGVVGEFESLTTNEALWICIVHPKLSDAVYFQFEPVHLGMPEIAVNESLEATLSVIPLSEPKWGAKPTA